MGSDEDVVHWKRGGGMGGGGANVAAEASSAGHRNEGPINQVQFENTLGHPPPVKLVQWVARTEQEDNDARYASKSCPSDAIKAEKQGKLHIEYMQTHS